MLRKWGMLVLMLLATPVLVLAQNTGKLAGQVTDADTGDPLPGAQVVVVGTTLGTVTDVDGNYFIIGVPVGSYDVQARFVGYQDATVSGVDVSSGYTQEVNFALAAGIELDEVVVEYERPLIQKDAIGVPKIVDSEEIVNLPVRGAANIAKTQAGVVSQEGSGTLNVRGGRGSEVTYYIDGVKVVGSSSVPQSAVQEQEMIIGNISARYGDAMSGIINITTKSGSPNFFGSFEGVTSEALDPYGYNLASLAIGGPVVGEKVNFFFSGEYLDQGDDNPRSVGELRLDDSTIDDLNEFPTALRALDAEGNDMFIPLPATLGSGDTRGFNSSDGFYAEIPVDGEGHAVVENGIITATDGTQITVPEGVDPATINFVPIERAGLLTEDDFSLDKEKRGRQSERLALSGNLTFSVIENVRFRLGGRFVDREGDTASNFHLVRTILFAPDNIGRFDRQDAQVYGTWTHYLSNNTFYQLQVDYTNRTGNNWDPRFENSRSDILNWGDFDNDAYATVRGYKDVVMQDVVVDDHEVEQPRYVYRYQDGRFPNTETVANLMSPSGGVGTGVGYFDFHNTQLRFNALATTQIGLHQIEFGGEFEQRTNRSWSKGAETLARFVEDPDAPFSPGAEALPSDEEGVTSLDQLTFDQLNPGYTGFNFRGTEEVDDENLTAFVNDCTDEEAVANNELCERAFGDAAYNIAPYEPLFYGGYVQDKIEFRDIVLNLGLRVDVFDNNSRVLFDEWHRLPVERAADLGLAGDGIDEDWTPYLNGDVLEGFRDLDGNFYDENGQRVTAGEVLLTNARPIAKSGRVTEEVFDDYEPSVSVMPRIGVSFPVTDQALFFARYGKVAQRPSGRNSANLESMAGTSGIDNNALEPEETTEYELGFRQRLSARSALTISGFFRQIDNLIQLDDRLDTFPQGYTTYENSDFGTVKGFEFDFDLRRTNNISLNANYTLSFAQGTGSADNTTGTIVWIDETPPNFISPLSFDQRHKLNLSMDYRLGNDEGPAIAGARVFENFGINVLATAGSGFPYTPEKVPVSQIASIAPILSGGINSARMPWTSRIDLRLDRKFSVGARTTLSAFLWVQNVLDTVNTFGVWNATGLPHDDGFLSTRGGSQFLSGAAPVTETLYRHRNRNLGNVGIPRITRIGVRLDF